MSLSHARVGINRVHPNLQTYHMRYTAAQTDVALVTAGPSERVVVKKVAVMSADGNLSALAFRVGFGAAATPTGAGVVASHPGLPKGSGLIEQDPSGLARGAAGEDLRITSDAASVGADVTVAYWIEGV